MTARLALALVVTATSATALHFHHHKTPASSATSVAPTGTVLSLVREPALPRRRTPVRASRRHTRPALAVVAEPAGRYADVTMYCATGNRNAAGRWPELGDVAVADRSIPFGTRVLIDGNVYTVRDWIGWGSDFDIYGGDAGCEQRALTFGRRHLRVVVER